MVDGFSSMITQIIGLRGLIFESLRQSKFLVQFRTFRGNHGSTFVTENTENVTIATRFSVPIPKGTYVSVEEYAKRYHGIVALVEVDPKTGEMRMTISMDSKF